MSEAFIECWNCHVQVTLAERSEEDGFCPHCVCELDLEDYLEQSVAAIDQLRADNERLREALQAFDDAARASGSIIGFAGKCMGLLKKARAALAGTGGDA